MAVQGWALEQLVKLWRYQPEMVDEALEKMLEERAGLRWSLVIGAYQDEEINLGKAAELLGIHRLELQERFIAQGIPLRIGPDTVEESTAEMAAIEAWNVKAEKCEQQ